MTDRVMVPNLDGLHFKISGSLVRIYLGQECLWEGPIASWSYALANPTR